MRGKKRATAVALAGVLTGGLVDVTAAQAADTSDVHEVPLDPASVDDPGALLKLYAPPPANARIAADPTADARCGDPAPEPIPDDAPIDVLMAPATAPFTVGKITPAMWKSPPVNEATWKLNFQGLMWMKSLARRAAMDGRQDALQALIDQAIAFHTDNPDPGTNDYGWDEGTALRRLETENCLYALQPTPGLVTVMAQDVGVLTGSRYYGPPNHPVHNHGLMANLQMVRAGDLVGKPAWKDIAVKRMTVEGPQAFSKYGFSYEQSSQYQLTNASLWSQAADDLEAANAPATAVTTIRDLVHKAYWVFSYMTEPDGKILQVGDAEEMAGRPTDLKGNRAVRDDQAGWVIGRWGWTDPNAPYYSVRYGPARRAHGHEDRTGGVTWSNKGTRILVGPGRYSYDASNPLTRYQLLDHAQNTAAPDKIKPGSAGTSTITTGFYSSVHSFTVNDTVYGGTKHTRHITVRRDTPTIAVADSFAGVKVWRQSFHLDPDWKLLPGGTSTKLVFIHPSGHKLTMATTGLVSGAIKGNMAGPYGWHFPRFQVAEEGYEVVVRNNGAKCTTTFWIS